MLSQYLCRGLAGLLLLGFFAASAPAKNKENPMLKDKYVKVNGVRLHYVTAGRVR